MTLFFIKQSRLVLFVRFQMVETKWPPILAAILFLPFESRTGHFLTSLDCFGMNKIFLMTHINKTVSEPWWFRGLISAMFTQASLASGRSAVGSNPDVGKRKNEGFFICSPVGLERRQKSDN